MSAPDRAALLAALRELVRCQREHHEAGVDVVAAVVICGANHTADQRVRLGEDRARRQHALHAQLAAEDRLYDLIAAL